MPKQKTTKSRISQETLRAVRLLQKKKLYRPVSPRAAPTRHAVRLVKKFQDVVRGQAEVLTLSKKLAALYAEQGARSGTVRVVRGTHVIVPVQRGEHSRFVKSRGQIEITRTMDGGRYVRVPLRGKHITFDDIMAQTKPGDYIAVPFFRGAKRGVEFKNMSLEEFSRFYHEYSLTDADGNVPYENLAQYVQLFRYEAVKEKRSLVGGDKPAHAKKRAAK